MRERKEVPLFIKRPMSLSSVITILFFVKLLTLRCNSENLHDFENLTPYVYQHGSRLNHRSIRECHLKKYGTEPHEIHFSHTSFMPTEHFVELKLFVKEILSTTGPKTIKGHHAVISDPLRTLSVLEPNQFGGCDQKMRQTVEKSALQKNCVLAVNAGYFNTKTGECLGNIVSDGTLVKDSGGIQNANFGLKKDGNIFIGYLSEEELYNNGSNNFHQLVSGVGMLRKGGKDYVNTSKFLECEETEETGSMDKFVNTMSARMALGHDKDGKIVIVQVDGKTGKDGASLWDMQQILEEFGVINAINLDGGGSATLVVNGTVVNYPYDPCDNTSNGFVCSRKVSTILCVHPPYCEPEDCSDHGRCIMGVCICEKNWLSPKCDELVCTKNNCSNQGVCTEQGCLCEPGWMGDNCENTCKRGWYGNNCKSPCLCINNSTCDSLTGQCICKPGFMGPLCQHECPFGYFGLNCAKKCSCDNSCFCDSVNGLCEDIKNSSIYISAQCLAHQLIEEEGLFREEPEDMIKRTITMDILSVITAVSISCCLLLIFFSCTCYCRSRRRLCFKDKKKSYKGHLPLRTSEKDCSDSSSENETIFIRPSAKS